MSGITEIVYLGRDNQSEIELSKGGKPIAWAGVTKMVLTILAETPVVVDSVEMPAALTWQTPGKITLKLGALSIPVGKYAAKLAVYDPGHSNGQILIDGLRPVGLTIEVRQA